MRQGPSTSSGLDLAPIAVAAAAVTALVLSGCSGYSDSRSPETGPSCDEVLSTVIDRMRADDADDAINAEFDWLSRNCPAEFGVATEYASVLVTAGQSESLECDFFADRDFAAETIRLLQGDGLCTDTGASGASEPTPADGVPAGSIEWSEAINYAGTTQQVCGPLISARETGDGTFLNIGRDYPSAERFTFIFWGIYLEPIATEATLCGAGEIYLYNGIPQMEMFDPSALEIWE